MTGRLVADAVPLPSDRVHFVPDLAEVAAELARHARPGDLLHSRIHFVFAVRHLAGSRSGSLMGLLSYGPAPHLEKAVHVQPRQPMAEIALALF